MFISLTVVIISQCIHTSNHHVVHLKYIPYFHLSIMLLVKLGETRKPTHRVKDLPKITVFKKIQDSEYGGTTSLEKGI